MSKTSDGTSVLQTDGATPEEALANAEVVITAVNEREQLREALRQIAAYDDRGANEILQRTGSYSGFDEPGAVQIARAALSDQNQSLPPS